jgi:acyl-coenzyme A synthetase/AMP-(fatty) acid ligase/acyl carrier protein
MQATPATWRMLLEAGWRGNGKLKILCGGEAFPRELADQLLTRSASVWNMYGPTETTIWSSVHRVEKGTGPLPIGRPILNTQFYILDEQRKPVPVGVPGELCIGGTGLARGYLNRPELTAEKFLQIDPQAALEDSQAAGSLARLYCTGDLVRYLPDGNIEFLGRSDQQVKIRGFRIELGEIETILSGHPDIREAVVIAREDMAGGKQLVGYLIARAASALDTNELRSFLKEKLPDYMIPAAYVAMDAFPLTANGKINRRALPAPEQSQSQKKVSFVAPSTPFEEILAEIFGEVLRLEKVGVFDNFFELGGHSLLATQIMSRVRDRFEVILPVRRLFEAPTIAELGPFLEQALVERIKAMQDDEKENILNS